MKRRIWIAVISAVIITVMLFSTFIIFKNKRVKEIEYTPQDGERYQNHIEIDGQWANSAYMPDGSTYGIGDPFVMRYNGKYYLYPSTADGRGGIKVFESTDLINWTYKGFAVEESEQTAVGAYAPEVVYYNGYFYMCQSRAGQGHYIYRSESPTEGFTLWSKNNSPLDSVDYGNLKMGIDGAFHVNDDGELFLLHTSTPAGLKYNQIKDVENITPDTVGAAKDLEYANLYGWIEGPGIIRRGDINYLTYTGNHVISSGYRIAYSYSKNTQDLSSFIQPKDNVTLIDTSPNHLGLGHSSNFYGMDLDSIYTAYHSYVGSGPSRRYNLDRYLTSGGVMTANGCTAYPVLAPTAPAKECEKGEELEKWEGIYLLGASEDYFTAEYNFIPQNGQLLYFSKTQKQSYSVELNDGAVRLWKNKSGNSAVIAEKQVEFPQDKLCTVRVESGDGVGYIYINGMRVITFNETLGAGQIGYALNDGVYYSAFSNDVFGTSDFEALKNFPTKFPATSYLKGEGRGFSIKGAKQVQGGLRVGEKQNLVSISEDDTYAVKLNKNDWVKYGIDVEKDGVYSIGARLTKNSGGATIKITASDSELVCSLPKDLTTDGETVKISLGNIELKKGLSSMKVEVLKGSAEIVTFETYKDAESLESVNVTDFEKQRGDVTIAEDGVKVVGRSDHSVALFGNKGTCNFEAELTFTCKLDLSSNLGIMIRTNDYSYFSAQPTQSWRGYYLQIGQSILTLMRYDYGGEPLEAIRLTNFKGDGTTEHKLKIIANSNNIKIALDDKFFIDATDGCAFLSGQLGIFSSSGEITVTSIKYKSI